MNSLKQIFSLLTFTSVFLICIAAAFGQADAKPQAEPNYDAILHVVVGSSDSVQADSLPQSLSAASKQLRSDFGATNLQLLNTYVGRMTPSGSLEYKGVSNAYAPVQESDTLTFLDWNLTGMKNLQNAAGQNVFEFQAFRFGARVPIKTSSFKDDSGKVNAVYNYESIGLTIQRMSVAENSPTLVGTLSQPRTNGTIFLILTVRASAK
jgi:hypothetical protein